MENITIDELLDFGFTPKGICYRYAIPNTRLEFCYIVGEFSIRLQTKLSGFTIRLLGVNSITELNEFQLLLTGNLNQTNND